MILPPETLIRRSPKGLRKEKNDRAPERIRYFFLLAGTVQGKMLAAGVVVADEVKGWKGYSERR
jgi:hypothetical protein